VSRRIRDTFDRCYRLAALWLDGKRTYGCSAVASRERRAECAHLLWMWRDDDVRVQLVLEKLDHRRVMRDVLLTSSP
jgi:hypothetical protein